MSGVRAIVTKELRAAFVSPTVYVVAAVFLLCFGILSFLFVQIAGQVALRQMQMQGAAAQLNLNDLVFRPLFSWTGFFLFVILLPILTMRLFAEEKKLRTFELLMTSPVGVNEIVVGKFLSVFIIFLGLLLLTGVVPLILSAYSSFDWNPVLTGYLALALTGGLFLATGVFASAMTENQIVAVLVSFGILFLAWLLGVAGMSIGETPIGTALSYMSFGEHFDRLIRGLIETKDLVYYASGLILMLFLAHRVVESQRWK